MEEMTDQEEFFAAFDANNHVYLLNFLLMTDPIHQMRKERENLERQWIRLRNCKETFVERDSVDTFLNKYDILENGFDDNFVERYNLSVVAHDTFMPQLDLERCQRGLEGYLKVFRLQLQLEDNPCILREDGNSLWRSAVQLVTIVVALYMKEGNDLSSQNINEIIEKSWFEENGRPCPILTEVDAVCFIHSIAPIAANDDGRLYGLYQDTLKLIQKQLQAQVDSIEEPSNMMLVKDLTRKKDFSLNEYDGFALQRLDTSWFKNPALLVGTTQRTAPPQPRNHLYDTKPVHSSIDYSERTKIAYEAPASTKVSGNPVFSDSIQTIEENNDIEGELDIPRWLDRVSMDLDDERSFSAELERESNQQSRKEKVNNDSDMKEVEQFQDKSAVSLPLARPSIAKPTTADLKESRASIRNPAGLIDRVKDAIGAKSSARESSDSEFEDDEYVPPLELKRKRPPTPPSALVQTSEYVQNDGYFAGEGSNSRSSLLSWSPSPIESARGISPRPVKPIKVRRRNRAWTSEEVDRLMALADKFQHRPSKTGRRAWKMSWSQLKKFDEMNGNILKHRTEVMLKDKYREKTDNGRHRQQVDEIRRHKGSGIPRYQFPPQDRGFV
ncbi:hypothetical protein BGX21_004365 [Mortierella sp. AD011]|nr:hypothetical protein BGX20_004771 [Mortierella sp. AD010]KAF9373664.1 hypothetical protein BGX21_004365 [Mortierella sp. AD011]